MSVKVVFLFFCIVFISLQGLAQEHAPVNPNASDGVKKILNFLYDIKGKYIISGEQNFNSELNTYSDSVKKITGKYPALWGSEFMSFGNSDYSSQVINEAIKKSHEGYLIQINWHEAKPTDDPPYEFLKNTIAKMSDSDWNQLLTPGTNLNKRWVAQLDVVAGYLKQLQDAGVTVLWRPYHEMNGVWFWWGNRKGPDGYTKLWRIVYDRFTNYHHLNNLIWVWSANGLRDLPFDEAHEYKDFYPGDKYVDVLGADVYRYDYEQGDYEKLLKLANGKPMALTETGELPKPDVLKVQPQWVWFMVWANCVLTENTHERVRLIYNLPQTLSLDEFKAKLDSLKK
jgi:mannan endo-1,4-beta-mannosidase